MQGSVAVVKTAKTKMRDEYKTYDRDRKRDKSQFKKHRKNEQKRKAYYDED